MKKKAHQSYRTACPRPIRYTFFIAKLIILSCDNQGEGLRRGG